LLLQGVGVPVKRGVEVFVLGITGDEVVEFLCGSLPVLCFDEVAAFAKDLHRGRVGFRLHKLIEFREFLIEGGSALRVNRENGYDSGDSQQRESGSDLGAIIN
jgi:hypothetical protein